jgi:hypothetical protein
MCPATQAFLMHTHDTVFWADVLLGNRGAALEFENCQIGPRAVVWQRLQVQTPIAFMNSSAQPILHVLSGTDAT